MISLRQILLFTALCQASVTRSRVEHGDPSATEGYLQLAHTDHQNLTSAVKAYTGNSTDIDNFMDNVWWDIRNAGDGSEGWHLSGPYTEKDARTICNYINITLYSDTKKLTKAILAKKKSFVTNGYNGTLSDSLNNLSEDYDDNVGYIIGASDGTKAQGTCEQASNNIQALLSSTANDLVN